MAGHDDPLQGSELQMHRLCREDPGFAAIWEDYREILAVLGRLEARPDVPARILDDYVRLKGELAAEIRKHLDARFPPAGGVGGSHD